MYKIIVWGKASNKAILEKEIPSDELRQNTLSWLRNHKIPVASSCDGDGVCKKCVINNSILSCKSILGDLLTKADEILVEISYL